MAQAFSSDCPVVPGSPLDGIYASMMRSTPSDRILNRSERIDAEAALYAYTAAPAYATKTERDRGSIEIGKLADFTVLNVDPTSLPMEEWESIKVEAAIVNGTCLYGELF